MLAGLAACQAPAPVSYGPPPVLDDRLAALYRVSCASCHGIEGSGAPARGDEAAWDPRWAKGYATLVQHTIEGYNGMPALGGCASCSRADLETLVQYLGGRSVIAEAQDQGANGDG